MTDKRTYAQRGWWVGTVLLVFGGLLACTPKSTDNGTGTPTAGGPPAPAAGTALQFWHTQTGTNEEALQAIVADFNQSHPDGPAVEATYIGSYTQLYEKIKASAAETRQRVLPDLAVAYESMIADYMAADIVRPLDAFAAELPEDELGDYFPAFLETNRFPQFDHQLLSFPFTKSLMMLYYNADLLAQVGEEPPRTWDDFMRAARKIKDQLKITPWPVVVDASEFDGFVWSMGGELVRDDGSLGFDDPATVDVLRLLQRAINEDLAVQVLEDGDQDALFAEQQAAMYFNSSTGRPFVEPLVGDKFDWGMTSIPTKAGVDPVTVLYGANICVFRSNDQRERRAWEFIRFFTSPAITARWAQATGYLPVRRSAADDPALQDFYAAAPRNRSAFDLVEIGRVEPNLAGWQDVRDLIEDTVTRVLTMPDSVDPEQLAQDLDQQAEAALQ